MNVLPMEIRSYMLEGECVVRFGDRMQHAVLVRQGDHAFVPADLPHAPCNESGAQCTWLVVHSWGVSGWDCVAAGARRGAGGAVAGAEQPAAPLMLSL